MVIVMHKSANTENVMMYNEKKVNEGVATFFHFKNTKSANPFNYDEKHRLKILLDIEDENPRAWHKCFHVSFNPSTEDYKILNEATIKQEIENMMEHMGYGHQPYFVYRHKDLERVHFHVVSTRIDCVTYQKLKDNFEWLKIKRFLHQLEEKYNLPLKEKPQEINFRFSARSRNIKENLENLFKHLNEKDELTTKDLYDQALLTFKVEVQKSGRGHIVVVLGNDGKPARYPIRLSNFNNKPKFYSKENRLTLQESVEREQKIEKSKDMDLTKVGVIARDVNRLVERSKWQKKESNLRYKTRKKKRGKRH
ncbi:relaxase/mobilization nuclease domain-containing protein [uncultured Draconibacterium sp.]|uniref:relaxase/mobilization nuclease domain-containing protein n=1 Tax=uncultured Draconibacterium sp. TaxID=1573823 RepID=UPI0029C862CF|nr:relaxase/mobilization nuclease domain-containing protein [uncultured Draconibacterium sp.]